MYFSTKMAFCLLLSLVFDELFFLPIVKAQNGGVPVSTQLWCVAKNNAEDAALQGALDWACGPGGADCSPIQQGGPCYDPTDIQKSASYVFNDYFLKHGMTDDSCSFGNNAAVTSLNPSYGSCKFPSSSGKASNGNISGSTSLGMGSDTADYNGSRPTAHQLWWFWPLIAVHLLSIITRTIPVN